MARGAAIERQIGVDGDVLAHQAGFLDARATNAHAHFVREQRARYPAVQRRCVEGMSDLVELRHTVA